MGRRSLAGTDAPSLQVPDGFDIFSAQFSRDGEDLVIDAHGSPPLTVIDYFTTDSPPGLEMPNGAMLTGDVVELLAGPRAPGQYAQADAPEGAEAIGRVETMTGSSTATRVSGETVDLAQGDPVFQGDVVETAGNSTLGLRLEDGTLASLSSDSRLVLNEFVFEAGGSDNWMVVNLVEGAFAFLTGAIAPSGGMEITTPVAVMAIRGTMPVAFVSGDSGATQFFAASDQDYELLHLTTREILAVISSEAGFSLSSPDAPLEAIQLDPETLDEIDGLLDVLNDAAAELGLLGIQDDSGFHTYSAFGSIGTAQLIQFLLLLDNALAEEAVLEVADPNQFLMAEAEFIATPDQAATDEMSPVVIDVLDNDNHPDNDDLTVVFADVPNGQGSVEVVDGQYLVFDPGSDFDYLALGETTDVVITYVVSDSTGAVATSTATVTLTGVNQAPVIAPVGDTSLDEQTDTEPLDATITVTFTDVDLNNVGHEAAVVDVTVSGEDGGLTLDTAELIALLTPGPVTRNAGDENGSVDIGFTAASGVFDYLAEGETVTLTYTVEIDDGDGGTTQQTFAVTITGTNDAPVIDETLSDVAATVVEDGFDAAGAPVGDPDASGQIAASDVDNGGRTFSVAQPNGSFGVFAISATGEWTYTLDDAAANHLALGQTETEQFVVTVTDSFGATDEVLVTITVQGSNEAPRVQDVSLSATEDGAAVPGSFSGRDGDSDDNPDTLTYTVVQPGEGSVINNGDGTFGFDPGNDFQDLGAGETREVTFTYTATDAHGLVSAPATVTVTVTGTNDVPVVSGVSTGAVTEDANPTTLTTGGALGIADPDAGQSSFAPQANVAGTYGSFTLLADGTWSYSADNTQTAIQELGAGATLTDSFTAVSSDGTESQTVTVTIHGTNDAPEVTALTGSVGEDGPSFSQNLLGGTSDADGSDTLSVRNVDGSVTTADGRELTAGIHYTVTGTTFALTAAGFALFNDLADGEADTITVNFEVFDGTTATANTLTVTVNGGNDAPVVTALSGSVGEDGPSFTQNLLGGASDVDASDALSVRNVDGSITTADGRTLTEGVHYTVTGSTFALTAAGFDLFGNLGDSETDSFVVNFEVFDGTDATANTLTVTVNGGNNPPVVTALSGSVGEDGPSFSQNLLGGASDADDSDTLSVQNVDGSVTTGDGRELTAGIHYTVTGTTLALTAAGFALFNDLAEGEADSFTVNFEVFDGIDATANTLTVTINGDNDVPVVTALSGSVGEDGPSFSKNLLGGTSDVDASDTLSVQNVDGSITTADGRELTAGTHYTVTGSTLALTAAGFALFNDLAAGEFDSFVVNFEVFDGTDATASALTVTVNGRNDDPVISVGQGDLAAADLTTDTPTPTEFVMDMDTGDPIYTSGETASVTFSISRDGQVEQVTVEFLMTSSHRFTLINLIEAINSADNGLQAIDSGNAFTFTLLVDGALDGDDLSATFTNSHIEGPNQFGLGVERIAQGSDAEGLSASGTLSVSDVDAADVVNASVVNELTIGGTGKDSLPGDLDTDAFLAMMSVGTNPVIASGLATGSIAWTFDSGDEAFGFLDPNETLVLTYTIAATDSAGAVTEHEVVITINGAGSEAQLFASSSEPESSSALMLSDIDGTDGETFVLTESDLTIDDVIIDYQEGDVIDLTRLGFELATGQLNAEAAGEYVAYDEAAGVLTVDVDGAGGEAGSELVAEFVTPPPSILVRLSDGDSTADIEIA